MKITETLQLVFIFLLSPFVFLIDLIIYSYYILTLYLHFVDIESIGVDLERKKCRNREFRFFRMFEKYFCEFLYFMEI